MIHQSLLCDRSKLICYLGILLSLCRSRDISTVLLLILLLLLSSSSKHRKNIVGDSSSGRADSASCGGCNIGSLLSYSLYMLARIHEGIPTDISNTCAKIHTAGVSFAASPSAGVASVSVFATWGSELATGSGVASVADIFKKRSNNQYGDVMETRRDLAESDTTLGEIAGCVVVKQRGSFIVLL